MKSNIIPLRPLSATSQVTPAAVNPSSPLINSLWYLKQGKLQETGIYRPKKESKSEKKIKRRMIQPLTSDAASVPSAFH